MELLNEIKNNIGIITFNRPNKLNSLSLEMLYGVKSTLDKWKKNDEIKLMLMEGSGEKAFCAGGDVMFLLENYLLNDNARNKMEFFTKEFNIDIYSLLRKVPLISHWKGVTMGGGVGISIGSDIVIADESVRFAMPETSLGFIPDVAVGYYFSRMEQALSMHIAMTGRIISGSDCVKLGLATHYIKSQDYKDIRKKILSSNFTNMSNEQIINTVKNIIKPYDAPLIESDLDRDLEEIRYFYSKPTLEEIFQALKSSNSDFAKSQLEILKKRPPLALAMQFEKYFRGKKWSRIETFRKDWILIKEMVDLGNVQEGIRTTMIDKNDFPNWKPSTLEEVDWNRIIYLMEEVR